VMSADTDSGPCPLRSARPGRRGSRCSALPSRKSVVLDAQLGRETCESAAEPSVRSAKCSPEDADKVNRAGEPATRPTCRWSLGREARLYVQGCHLTACTRAVAPTGT